MRYLWIVSACFISFGIVGAFARDHHLFLTTSEWFVAAAAVNTLGIFLALYHERGE